MFLDSAAVEWLMSQDSCQLLKALEVLGSRSQYVCVLLLNPSAMFRNLFAEKKKKTSVKVFSLQDIPVCRKRLFIDQYNSAKA